MKNKNCWKKIVKKSKKLKKIFDSKKFFFKKLLKRFPLKLNSSKNKISERKNFQKMLKKIIKKIVK